MDWCREVFVVIVLGLLRQVAHNSHLSPSTPQIIASPAYNDVMCGQLQQNDHFC